MFLDETGAATGMIRDDGRSLGGSRLVDAAPHGHWRSISFVTGLRLTGIVASLALDRPMTGELFRAYVDQVLARRSRPATSS